MVSKVKVNAPICDHETEIIARASGNDTLVEIRSNCRSVQTYAERLNSVSMDDIMDTKGSKIIELAGEVGLTSTCLIPTAVYNACWIEQGMISKRLALAKERICIEFIE
ncbi:MAG: hypothetical protein LLG16_06640 [Euryarchaeota archaeon]|nr:hypothetical protein [Euryarchaeota archaeon]